MTEIITTIIKVIFFIALIICAVKIGTFLRDKKNNGINIKKYILIIALFIILVLILSIIFVF